MIGRSPTRFVLAATAMLAVAGCSTFTDAEVAARVGDAELTEDQMADLLRESAGDDDATVASAQDVSEILNNFVLNEALRNDLRVAGVAVPEPATDELTRATLDESVGVAVSAWQTAAPSPVEPELMRATYDRGLVDSNMACTAHILVEDEATADDVLDQLSAGGDFAELAAEHSIDPGSAALGGALPCDTTGNFSQQYIPEYVTAAVEADIGVPVGPVQSQFGFHVIVVRPYDDLTDTDLTPLLSNPAVRFGFAVSGVDVYVNPRYGTFDPTDGVVPLG